MKTTNRRNGTRTVGTLAAVAMASLITATSANAALVSQYGILDPAANGGINPNTGVAWAAGDQYRLAFHTDGTINAQSNNPADYDNFATAQAQQNAALAASSGWTAMVYVNTNGSLDQGVSPVSDPKVRSGTDDQTGGAGIGGAGVPVYAMDGMTAIARNNADIYNTWSNPFDGDTTLRLPGIHYSPFLDQFASGDTGTNHGANNWTGGLPSQVNPLGDTPNEVRASWGSSNANTNQRTYNRFNSDNTASLGVYAISELLTLREAGGGAAAVPEPGTAVLATLGLVGLMGVRRRRRNR